MTEVKITLEALQGSKVFVDGPNNTLFRLDPSFKVGEFILRQLPSEVVEEVVEPEPVEADAGTEAEVEEVVEPE